MSFALKDAPDAPKELPFVCEVINRRKVLQYEDFCKRNFPQRTESGLRAWFYSRGHFFFATKAMRAQFMLSADNVRTTENPSISDEESIHGLFRQLNERYGHDAA